MAAYNHKKRDRYWQEIWEKSKLYEAQDDSKLSKYYCLIEFPYPSGDGLHVGHVRPYIGLDIIARKRRAEGYNVLFPIGWDAFGLPTENYAIKMGIHPAVVTEKNTDNFKRQIQLLGISFDWSREINTTEPEYYKWTQWIFLQLFKEGLAYKAKMPINWCLSCKIGLANEEVVDGRCERCGGETEKREKEQWMLAITKYADRLEKDLDDLDYLEKIKIQQKNWIGRSEGALLQFQISNFKFQIEVFTTRADTLFGATYMVLAPEHPLLEELKGKITNWPDVEKYIKNTKKKTEIERMAEEREKTGVCLKGVTVINPATKKEIPIWIADYVLIEYGTGAIMAVPAHDDRDYEFAKKFSLPIIEVISGGDISKEAYLGEGALVNSGKFDGLESDKAKGKITKYVHGKGDVRYKLRDWIFSRQHYWGEPIPLAFCEQCKTQAESTKHEARNSKKFNEGELLNPGWIAVRELDLPIKLPDIQSYKPTDTGESPLAKIEAWVNVNCPKCKGKAQRETDTMPNWAGSSWYFLRYTDPHNNKNLAGKKNLQYWTPVDWYNGGMEHTTLHLLYSRFWHKFLYDIGVVPTKEPYAKRTSHGMILAEGGVKMSKSKGNVINPDDIVEKLGADTLRLYEMFIGPFDQAISWNSDDIVGVKRFLDKVYDLVKSHQKATQSSDKLKTLLHETIKKVSEDLEGLAFNTAIAQLMIFINEVRQNKDGLAEEDLKIFLRLLSPFAPHITEELWRALGEKQSIHLESWPKAEKKYLIKKEITIVIEVNGRVRANIIMPVGSSEDEVLDEAKKDKIVQKHLEGKEIKKVVFVKDRVINIVL